MPIHKFQIGQTVFLSPSLGLNVGRLWAITVSATELLTVDIAFELYAEVATAVSE
jgi:hypothetical protein